MALPEGEDPQGGRGGVKPDASSAIVKDGYQDPTSPPSSFMITTTEGRGGMPSWKLGQRVAGCSKLEGRPNSAHSCPSSAGCCTATNRFLSSGVNVGPQSSAPTGQRKKCFDKPRRSPLVSSAQRPSERPVAL